MMTFRAILPLAAALIAAPLVLVPASAAPNDAPQAAKPAKPAHSAKSEPVPTAESLLAQSRAAAAKGDTQLALRMAQSAIVADPARPASYVALGDIYARAGEDEYARSYYQAALGIDPSDSGALRAMAALDKPQDATAANSHP